MVSAIVAAALALIGFVITQSVLKFIIEPIQEQRILIGEVAHALLFYANVHVDADPVEFWTSSDDWLGSKKEDVKEARKTLRTLAGRLNSSLWSIPLYDLFASLRLVPKPTDVFKASAQLVGWSNGLVSRSASEATSRRIKTISETLHINRKLEE